MYSRNLFILVGVSVLALTVSSSMASAKMSQSEKEERKSEREEERLDRKEKKAEKMAEQHLHKKKHVSASVPVAAAPATAVAVSVPVSASVPAPVSASVPVSAPDPVAASAPAPVSAPAVDPAWQQYMNDVFARAQGTPSFASKLYQQLKTDAQTQGQTITPEVVTEFNDLITAYQSGTLPAPTGLLTRASAGSKTDPTATPTASTDLLTRQPATAKSAAPTADSGTPYVPAAVADSSGSGATTQ